MKRILFFFIFITTLQAQPIVKRTIESITYRSQVGSLVCSIKLSDGSTWKWIPDIYSENLLRKWSEEDEVIIRIHNNHPGFLLHNLSKPHYTPTVALNFNSYSLFPYITKLLCEDYLVELSDGSKWEVVYDFNKRTLCHWAVGDRIICVQGIHDDFELINLDIPCENRCQIERNMQVAFYSLNEPDFLNTEEVNLYTQTK